MFHLLGSLPRANTSANAESSPSATAHASRKQAVLTLAIGHLMRSSCSGQALSLLQHCIRWSVAFLPFSA